MQRAKTNRIPGLSLIGFHRAFVLEVHLFPFPFELKVRKSQNQFFLTSILPQMKKKQLPNFALSVSNGSSQKNKGTKIDQGNS